VALNPDRAVATVNQVAASMLGINVTDVVGKKAASVLPERIHGLVDRLDEDPEIIDCQIDCKLSDDRTLSVEATATILEDENGQFFGYALLLKDLTELQALRKEVARTQRLATVGRLAGGVAHEIRNPLSSIKGFATYFKERYPDVAEDQRIAGIMIQEVDKLNRVVGQLLEFARPVSIVKKYTPLMPLIDDSLKLVEQQARDKNVRIESNISPQSLEGWLDPDRINQVLLNLYLNALEAMEADGVLKVTATRSPESKSLVLRISDTGPGVDPENLTHIFDPYYTTKPSGTGLGLAIVHNIIEAHHGHIIPESRPEEGTAMTIYLPLPDNAGKENQTIEQEP
jgi:two-component system sensor histidine kinase HydH